MKYYLHDTATGKAYRNATGRVLTYMTEADAEAAAKRLSLDLTGSDEVLRLEVTLDTAPSDMFNAAREGRVDDFADMFIKLLYR